MAIGLRDRRTVERVRRCGARVRLVVILERSMLVTCEFNEKRNLVYLGPQRIRVCFCWLFGGHDKIR